MAYKYLDLTARRTIEALYLADNDARRDRPQPAPGI